MSKFELYKVQVLYIRRTDAEVVFPIVQIHWKEWKDELYFVSKIEWNKKNLLRMQYHFECNIQLVQVPLQSKTMIRSGCYSFFLSKYIGVNDCLKQKKYEIGFKWNTKFFQNSYSSTVTGTSSCKKRFLNCTFNAERTVHD